MRNLKTFLASLCVVSASGAGLRGLQMMGGFSPIDKDDEMVRNAASFALLEVEANAHVFDNFSVNKDESSGVAAHVISAEKQVVAGLNFKLTIEVGSEDECLGGFDVVVYQKFDGEMSVTEWGEEHSCDEIAAMMVDGDKLQGEEKAESNEEGEGEEEDED